MTRVRVRAGIMIRVGISVRVRAGRYGRYAGGVMVMHAVGHGLYLGLERDVTTKSTHSVLPHHECTHIIIFKKKKERYDFLKILFCKFQGSLRQKRRSIGNHHPSSPGTVLVTPVCLRVMVATAWTGGG